MSTLKQHVIALSVAMTAGMIQSPAHAGSSGAFKASTQGLGVELTTGLSDHMAFRVDFNYFQLSRTMSESDIDYDLDLELKSVNFLVDYHPFDNGFRITAGGVWDKNSLNGQAVDAPTYSIGDQDYTQAEVGTLAGRIDFRDVSPYVGIGFGHNVRKEGGWNFAADIGVVFTGSPRVSLTSTGGTLSNNATFQENILQEQQNVADGIDFFRYYPVISLGVTYSF
ncbi:hypothetical protein [Emcibacter sp.]|uniref:hypothetical protein n=1 Tax=Emcibacter sp. TaxID=1979954 RepID=UPI002AA6DDCC|nr:hypothetical protein [Emcibacter sp.]